MLIPEAVYFVIGYWILLIFVAGVLIYEWLATRSSGRRAQRLEMLLSEVVNLGHLPVPEVGVSSHEPQDQALEERVEDAEKHIRQLSERQGQLALSGEGRPYDLAIDLVRQGADADKLMSSFGLSQGEAHLVTLMHGGQSRQNAS